MQICNVITTPDAKPALRQAEVIAIPSPQSDSRSFGVQRGYEGYCDGAKAKKCDFTDELEPFSQRVPFFVWCGCGVARPQEYLQNDGIAPRNKNVACVVPRS
jgi:hypothetical protein